MKILQFEDLPQGGFAGLKEKRFVMDTRIFGSRKNPKSQNGIGNFVYLADANFAPNGETGLHSHHEIDVISIMVEGNIMHAGSLEHGQGLNAGMVQVQRAGAEGFSHNEINPDNAENQMIQVWVAPDESGEPAGYKTYSPTSGERLHIYGGPKDQNARFYSQTNVDVINAEAGQVFEHAGEVMAYLSKGSGTVNGKAIPARTLVKGQHLTFHAGDDAQLILIYV